MAHFQQALSADEKLRASHTVILTHETTIIMAIVRAIVTYRYTAEPGDISKLKVFLAQSDYK